MSIVAEAVESYFTKFNTQQSKPLYTRFSTALDKAVEDGKLSIADAKLVYKYDSRDDNEWTDTKITFSNGCWVIDIDDWVENVVNKI
jgi:hypothetical protein